MEETVGISDLMDHSGVKFGTSGARGLASDMTDRVCYAYTLAFVQYLEESGRLGTAETIAIGGDLRPSTGRIVDAVARAVSDRGHKPLYCGRLPSPALAHYGLVKEIATVMVTGSHIPEDRNGIKFTKKEGEILKHDEEGISRQRVGIPGGLFDERGMFVEKGLPLASTGEAVDLYVERYMKFFPAGCLKGKRIGVYQHSAVGRDLVVRVLSQLGAHVTALGRSDQFIPVDTEAIRPEDMEAAAAWCEEGRFDAIVSTDGDSDRPLISDERGKWLRGDVAGILCAAYLGADAVATPVSCNTAVERCGLFKKVYRTKIGSPFVIEAMLRAGKEGWRRVVGYEANGGFLTASSFERYGSALSPLPTRDALIVHLALLALSIEKGKSIGRLVEDLPPRFTFSNRLKEFPTEQSRAIIARLCSGDEARDREVIGGIFGVHFGQVASLDTTDGLRITFESSEIVHLRPSGNAPEFRCYNEADSESRAVEMNRICMEIMEEWRQGEAATKWRSP